MKNSAAIREAIETLSFTLNNDYDLYFYTLNSEEEFAEKQKIEEARNYLVENGVAYDAAFKHYERQKNIEPEPIRFIDKVHFKAVESDQLAI